MHFVIKYDGEASLTPGELQRCSLRSNWRVGRHLVQRTLEMLNDRCRFARGCERFMPLDDVAPRDTQRREHRHGGRGGQALKGRSRRQPRRSGQGQRSFGRQRPAVPSGLSRVGVPRYMRQASELPLLLRPPGMATIGNASHQGRSPGRSEARASSSYGLLKDSRQTLRVGSCQTLVHDKLHQSKNRSSSLDLSKIASAPSSRLRRRISSVG